MAFYTSKGPVSQTLVPPVPNVQVYPAYADSYRYVRVLAVLKFVSPIPPHVLAQPPHAVDGHPGGWLGALGCGCRFSSAGWVLRVAVAGLPRVLDVEAALSYQMYERHILQRGLGRLRTWVSWQKAQQCEMHLFRRFQACSVTLTPEPRFNPSLKPVIGCNLGSKQGGRLF